MIYYIGIYFVIGVILNLVYEFLFWWLKKNGRFIEDLTDYEKIYSLIFWPLGLFAVIRGYIKHFYKK